MRIVTFLMAVFFVTMASSPLYAASDRCPRHQVKTSLKNKLAKTKVFKGTSDNFTDYILGHHRGEGRILGFVNQSEIYTELRYKFGVQKVGEDRYCVKLEEVKGFFYAAPKLYLPTDYKKSSCEYKEVYKHEQRHLKVVYNFHKKNSKKYSSQLGRIARSVPISKPATTREEAEETKQMIINYFENEFRAFELKSIMELNALQTKIDSPSEYRGVQKRCKNW